MTKILYRGGETPSVIIDDMPVWLGMQSQPGVAQTKKFELVQQAGHPITQKMSEDFFQDVINRYSREDYGFITAPPGQTLWSKYMALEKLDHLQALIGNERRESVLEIGCGNTWFAQAFCQKFTPDQYVCVDPTLEDAVIGSIRTVADYFPSTKVPNQQFDVILAYSVLEHVADPHIMLSTIADRLSADGKAIIAVPDCHRQLKEGDINGLIHEHITYFTAETISSALNSAGLEIVEMSSKCDLFTLVVKRQTGASSVPLAMSDDTARLETAAAAYQHLFETFAEDLKRDIASGGRVAFHGATQGLNTFLYLTGLNEADISIYDGEKAKAGQYLSACSKPVKHWLEDDYCHHDIMVVSAMSFFDAISAGILKRGFRPNQIRPMGSYV